MGLFRVVTDWFSSRSAANPPEPPADTGPLVIRRFDSATNDCIHPDRWIQAQGLPINTDLLLDLKSTQARAQEQQTNNPFFRGVVNTYALHVVGPRGPTLQIQGSSKKFADLVEKHWKKVFKMPDPAGKMSGVDSLKIGVKQMLTAGSTINVFKQTRRPGPVKFGWQTIHPRRLVTPASEVSNPSVMLGIQFGQDEQPVNYFIGSSQIGSANASGGPYGDPSIDPKRVPADLVQHTFIADEGEQVTAAPLMHSSVKTAKSLQEYDADVMEASKNAARNAFLVESRNPEAIIDPDPAPEGLEIERGAATVIPMGWTGTALPATHPTAVYREFRHERLSELGRPIHMPLMLVLLSSAGSNFSSAQFDGTIYAEGIAEMQAVLERQQLEEQVEQVVIELVLEGVVRREDYEPVFSWPKPPHANIEKITKALRTQLEDGGISLVEYCVALGLDYEKVQGNRQRVNEMLEKMGLPPVPANLGSGGNGGDPSNDDPSDEDAPEKDDDTAKAAKAAKKKKQDQRQTPTLSSEETHALSH